MSKYLFKNKKYEDDSVTANTEKTLTTDIKFSKLTEKKIKNINDLITKFYIFSHTTYYLYGKVQSRSRASRSVEDLYKILNHYYPGKYSFKHCLDFTNELLNNSCVSTLYCKTVRKNVIMGNYSLKYNSSSLYGKRLQRKFEKCLKKYFPLETEK